MGTNTSALSEGSQAQRYQAKKGSLQRFIKPIYTKDEWKTYLSSVKSTNKLVVIDFTATWCGPCRSMEPFLKALCEKYTEVDFVKLDVDRVSDVASEYGVQAMPTFLLMKRGEEIAKVVGAKKDDLQGKIELHKNFY